MANELVREQAITWAVRTGDPRDVAHRACRAGEDACRAHDRDPGAGLPGRGPC